ncbi:hypothetical protein FHX13_002035 [Rhizobium sp. BK612]|nr:hypothetical protein [Rhizobium sp. BK098]MBB3680712.1 hypothetical protein [Rhizobium sp. BK612]
MLLETAVGRGAERKLPLASMTVFPNFGTVWKICTPTARQDVISSRVS